MGSHDQCHNLNIEEYSSEELFHLFGIQRDVPLTEEVLKKCNKIVLKTHPDKSKLQEDYFLFFSNAYKKLLSMYEADKQINKRELSQEEMNVINCLFNTQCVEEIDMSKVLLFVSGLGFFDPFFYHKLFQK